MSGHRKTWNHYKRTDSGNHSEKGAGGPRGSLTVDGSNGEISTDEISPGLKYPHYRTSAPLFLYEGTPQAASEAVRAAAAAAEAEGRKAGVIDFHGNIDDAAKLFFKELRRLDGEKVDVIYAAGVSDSGIGEAVMNRMRNAAGENIIKL
ncbi:MAG: Sua5 family C-terminal domain-containing protein [Anaerovoracaceae bacterium]